MRDYPAKLLLFGEHILLRGASALAIPIPYYHGRMAYNNTQNEKNALKKKLWSWAKSDQLATVPGFDPQAFQTAIQNGLVFQSNIPIGYGLGSSGALCAAVYDHFCADKKESLSDLKIILAGMESFFHGSSSGIDPLTSYINKALLISNLKDVSAASPMSWQIDMPYAFLIDSGLPRKSETMITWFKEQAEKKLFAQWLDSDYLPTNEKCLSAWLDADASVFWNTLEDLSRMQMQHLDFLIPHTMKTFWAEGLNKKDFFLKICGAGGGGFVLGFARSSHILDVLAERHPIGHSVVNVNI